ncbi:MAG: hypothetical protein AAF950_17360 [Pseudomonadota bacterium]
MAAAAASALTVMAVWAMVGADVGILALAVTGILTVAGGIIGSTAGLLAALVPGAIGVASVERRARLDRRGMFAGGISLLLLWAIGHAVINGVVDNAAVILVITFFLLLPLANGLWDWLSWRVSRRLGRDLLKKLDGGRQAWTITWHAVVDAAVAIVLLATLAFALAFGVETYNQFAEARAGNEVYDLTTFVRDAAAKPWTVPTTLAHPATRVQLCAMMCNQNAAVRLIQK